MRLAFVVLAFSTIFNCSIAPRARANDEPVTRLASDLSPWLDCLVGRTENCAIVGRVVPMIDGKAQPIEFNLVRYDDQAFDLQITHAEYAVDIRRRADAIAFALPKHKVVFLGQGSADAEDHLEPEGALARLIGPALSCRFIPRC